MTYTLHGYKIVAGTQADPVTQHVLSWLVHKVKLMVALTLQALLIKLPILISLLAIGWGRHEKEKKKKKMAVAVAEQKASPKSTQGAFKASQ